MASKRIEPTPGRTAWLLSAGYLVLCLGLGGGTAQGLPAEALLQLLALPLIVHALVRWRHPPVAARWALVFAVAMCGLLMLQLLPLPPAWWMQFGGRAELANELQAAGVPLGWHALSLDPDATLRALFAWLPPLAIGLLAIGLTRLQRTRLLQLVMMLALASAVLGLAQLADGPESALRWHRVTNTGAAVGPFANRNHLASLLVLALPIATAQMIGAGTKIALGERAPGTTTALVLGIVASMLLMLALAIVRSRAGVALATFAVLAAVPMLWRRLPTEIDAPRRGVKRWLAFAGVGGLILAIQFGFWGLLQRFEADPMEDLRWTISKNTLAAAEHFGALGVGAGGFVAAYASQEPDQDRQAVWINRAHNDWAEWWLEGGWPFALVIAGGLLWLIWRTVSAWRDRDGFALWQRASAIGLWLLLLHSFGDYPLRTTALTSVAALLVACLCTRSRSAPDARTAPE